MRTNIYHSPKCEIIAIRQVQTLCASDPTQPQPVTFSTIPGEGEGL